MIILGIIAVTAPALAAAGAGGWALRYYLRAVRAER